MTITAEEIASKWPDLLEKIDEGEEVTLTRGGIPFARLVAVSNGQEAETDDVVERILKLRDSIAPGPPFLRELLEEARQHSYERKHG